VALAVACAGLIGSDPVSASSTQKFEGTIAVPAHDAGPEVFADACPKGNQFNGMTYRLFDLKGEFSHLKTYGPKHLINEPGPAYHDINDYDIDMYAFDSKCREITPSGANGPAGTEKFSTRRPARWVVVAYWSGVHKDLKVTLEASTSPLK
jgi:hypothetical protein